MSTDTTYTFSGALTLKRVQTRSAAASVSSLKISPAPHELLAVGDTKGVLTVSNVFACEHNSYLVDSTDSPAE